MTLESITVCNYKCFNEPQTVEFDEHMTVIVGRNNAGKSALLETLTFELAEKPHRSISTHAVAGRRSQKPVFATGVVRLSGAEVLALAQGASAPVAIPVAQVHQRAVSSHTTPVSPEAGAPKVWRAIIGRDAVLPVDTRETTNFAHGKKYLGQYAPPGTTWSWYVFELENDGSMAGVPTLATSKGRVHKADLAHVLLAGQRASTYVFHAERMNVGMAPFGREQRLAPNATNLPEVLNSLQHVKVRFHRYTQLVRRVLPQVANVSVRPHPELDGQLEILVWSGDPDSEREDLAIPLLESGTGVSQVLAMLYVVLTADTRRTIAIDEPTCFLHPGAVRALLEVFREYPQHQYILATHSPSVIAAANPGRLYLLENDGNQARVVPIDPEKVLDQRRTLDAVGADLGDVLGPERILWLEGKTEERCFPLIARRLCKIDLAKTAMLGVVATGDFDLKRDKRRVQLSADVYQRLSSGIGLIPPAVGFVFDREDLTDEQCARLREKVPAPVHFLPRKLYENYLLHPKAVAAVLGQFAIDEARVREWIEANRGKLGGKGQDWEHKVDGAKLLKNMFTELSESQLAYDKVSHGQELTEWLLAEDPSHLQEVADLIVTVLEVRAV